MNDLLNPDRFFSPNPEQRKVARGLYEAVKDLPLISPHGHVDPNLFADPDHVFGSPTELLLIPDHYVFRMLYSQGYTLDQLGIPTLDGSAVEEDHRKIWQIFGENFYLFRGTPTGAWLNDELANVFGITEKLNGDNAQEIYHRIDEQLKTPAFQPRRMFETFNIEVLSTTDAATDTLEAHQKIRASGWNGRIIPTFRPDMLLSLDSPGWRDHLEALEEVTGALINDLKAFVTALESRRAFFREMGAMATDHGAPSALTLDLPTREAEAIFQRALRGEAASDDAERFMAYMLVQMAGMSVDDGLVMQLHVGSFRSHNTGLYQKHGANMGADIPIAGEFTRNLKPLLDRFGHNPNLTLILFTLDETNYARELAPLAGHYPALKLGPPWWFHDSFNGMQRYFDQVMETAGLYNTAGFNDDTRAYPSIPARHDVWRRASCDWIASLLVRHIIDEVDAQTMAHEMAYGLVKSAYKL